MKGNEKTGEDGPIRVEGEKVLLYGLGKMDVGGPIDGERLRRLEKWDEKTGEDGLIVGGVLIKNEESEGGVEVGKRGDTGKDINLGDGAVREREVRGGVL